MRLRPYSSVRRSLILKHTLFPTPADDRDVLDRRVPQTVHAFLARNDAGVFPQIDVQVVLAVAQDAAAFENLAGYDGALDALGRGEVPRRRSGRCLGRVQIVIHTCCPSRWFVTANICCGSGKDAAKRRRRQKFSSDARGEVVYMEKKLEALEEKYASLAERLEEYGNYVGYGRLQPNV